MRIFSGYPVTIPRCHRGWSKGFVKMGLPITGLFGSSAEAIVAVEELELFDVHPPDTLPDVSE